LWSHWLPKLAYASVIALIAGPAPAGKSMPAQIAIDLRFTIQDMHRIIGHRAGSRMRRFSVSITGRIRTCETELAG
jgi:hypothetical protein